MKNGGGEWRMKIGGGVHGRLGGGACLVLRRLGRRPRARIRICQSPPELELELEPEPESAMQVDEHSLSSRQGYGVYNDAFRRLTVCDAWIVRNGKW